MRDTELFYLQHKIKKPEDMEPREFLHRFYEILTISLKLQGLFHEPNEHEIKTIFFNAFPLIYISVSGIWEDS